MNNTTHTPGPWKAVQHPREHKWAWTIEGADGVGQSIARMGLVNDAQAVAANAHLIAAAPAMYEALQDAYEKLCYLAPDKFDDEEHAANWQRDLSTMLAALAHAEGRR